MAANKINITNKDIIWNYMGVFISMSMNYFMIPFMVNFLSSDMLGLWYVFQNIGYISVLFDCGFSISFARNINYCWCGAKQLLKKQAVSNVNDKVDFHLMKVVILTSKVVYLFIAVLAVSILSVIGSFYINYITIDIKSFYMWCCWGIYILALFFNLYYGYYISFLRGLGQIARLNQIIATSRILQLTITIILLYLGWGLIGACIAYICYSFSLRVQAKRAFYKTEGIKDGLDKSKGCVGKKDIRNMIQTIWYNAWRDGVVSISDYLLNQAGTVFCSIYFTLTQTGRYSLTIQLICAVGIIASAMHTNYIPVLQSAYIEKNKEMAKKVQSLSIVSFILLYWLGIIFFIVIIVPCLELIKPNTILEIPLILISAIYYFIVGIRNISTYYFSTTNRIPYVRAFIVSALINVVLAFLLLEYLHMSVLGMIIAQIISQILYNAWKWTIQVHRELDLGFIEQFYIGFNELKNMYGKGRKK